MRRAVVIVVLLALVFQPVSVGTVGAATDSTIQRTTTLSLTPDAPGAVDATVEFDVPSNVGSITTSVPADATVTDSVGFEPDETDQYTWDGEGSDPQLTMTVPANRTGVGMRDHTTSSGYEFVDTGSWAIVSAPAMSTSWTYSGDKPTFKSGLATDGPGVAGDRMVYLGPSTEYQRSAHGQTFTLVVPDAATMEESPEAILDSFEAASLSLRVGERDPAVTVFAAPTSVDWAAGGLASDADAWVQADSPLDDPNNVWLHEYVHTRTDFRTTEDARWLTEASAEYYAGLLSLEQGLVSFDAFQRHLSQGARDPYGSSVMTRPDTWAAGANYLKGALVFGSVDHRLRVATDSSHTTGDVLARLNDREDPVSHSFVRQAVEDLGGSATAEYLDRYATTQAAPDVWSRDEHADAFSKLPPQMVVESNPTYTVSGPYRNLSTTQPPILVPGETLTVAATVTNRGDVAGSYNVTMLVDEEPVDSVSGELDAGESTHAEFTTTFDGTGTKRITLGEASTTVTVESPATVEVSGLSTDRRSVPAGSTLTVEVTASNPSDKPATGDLAILADGETVSTWTPMLDVGESEQATIPIVLDEPGTHTITVGDQSVDVTVERSNGGPDTPVQTPGFGAVFVGISFVLVALSFRWWRDR
ncbi:MAG: CARDB domain-containing protein [Halanaeroarchaeum sp.]